MPMPRATSAGAASSGVMTSRPPAGQRRPLHRGPHRRAADQSRAGLDVHLALSARARRHPQRPADASRPPLGGADARAARLRERRLRRQLAAQGPHLRPGRALRALRGGLHPQALARPVQGRGERRRPHRRRARLAGRDPEGAAGRSCSGSITSSRTPPIGCGRSSSARSASPAPPTGAKSPGRTATTPRSPSPTSRSDACSRPSTGTPSSRPVPCSSSPPIMARAWASTATGGTAAISTSPPCASPSGSPGRGRSGPA